MRRIAPLSVVVLWLVVTMIDVAGATLAGVTLPDSVQAGGKTLVYSLDTKIRAHDLESHASGLAIVGAAIADRLRRDGLIH